MASAASRRQATLFAGQRRVSSGRSVTSPFTGRSVWKRSRALRRIAADLLSSHTLSTPRTDEVKPKHSSNHKAWKKVDRWPENLDMRVCSRLRDGTDLLALLPHLLWSPFTQQGTVSATPPTVPVSLSALVHRLMGVLCCLSSPLSSVLSLSELPSTV